MLVLCQGTTDTENKTETNIGEVSTTSANSVYTFVMSNEAITASGSYAALE